MSQTKSNIDKVKPELGVDEILCGGCWATSLKSSAINWHYFNFKYLDPTWLCPDCQEDRKWHLMELQGAGL